MIGGGVAGLSAALVLSRARRTVLVIDGGSPRNAPTAYMHGFLSRDGMPPVQLLAVGRSEVSGYGGTILTGSVTDVAPSGTTGFRVTLVIPAGTLSETHRAQLSARSIDAVEGEVTRVRVDNDRLSGIEMADGRFVSSAAVFVPPRLVPNNALVIALGCAIDQDGWVVTGLNGHTGVPGVWVAGNLANPRAQVITAAGEGSAAAIAVNSDLVDDDVRQAIRRYESSPVARLQSPTWLCDSRLILANHVGDPSAPPSEC